MGGVMASLARVSLLLLVVLSYMIMTIPCKIVLLDVAFGKTLQTSSNMQFLSATALVNVGVVAVAYCVQALSLVLDIDGSIIANLTAFILPALYHLKIRSLSATETEKRTPIFSAGNSGMILTFVFGVASLVLGAQEVFSHLLE